MQLINAMRAIIRCQTIAYFFIEVVNYHSAGARVENTVFSPNFFGQNLIYRRETGFTP